MKVNFSGYNLYKNQQLKKGLEFVADYGALFKAGTALTLATVARPIAIYSTPRTDKENKKLACAKSIASSAIGFGLMMGVSLPVSNCIKKIDTAPEKYLKKSTISALKDGAKKLTSSKGYQFATQLFKLGIDTAFAVPKTIITCAMIPAVMSLIFPNKKVHFSNDNQKNQDISIKEQKPLSKKSLNFTGKIPNEPLTKGIAKIIDTEFVQNITKQYKDTNYPMHLSALTDTVATGAFIAQVSGSKKIDESRKTPLIYNSAIATGLSIVTGYGLDKALDKPTEKFISKFKEANKTSPKLDKYVEGIKIAKPTLLLGAVYYCVIPLLSTFFAERVPNHDKTNQNRRNSKPL